MKIKLLCLIGLFITGIIVGLIVGYTIGFNIREQKIDDNYKFVVQIRPTDMTEEQFKELSNQWIHYLCYENWTLDFPFEINSFKIEER